MGYFRSNRLRGVIFDFDGTLVSQELDFPAIRQEIGLPVGQPLLEALERMTGSELERALAIIDRHERAAAATAQLLPGVREFTFWLKQQGVLQAVLSRNSRHSVREVLRRLDLAFDSIVAREDAPYKPDPGGIFKICSHWGVAPSDVAMIGDFLFDIEAARRAGAWTALITHGRNLPFAHMAHVTFPSFEELPDLLREWFGGST